MALVNRTTGENSRDEAQRMRQYTMNRSSTLEQENILLRESLFRLEEGQKRLQASLNDCEKQMKKSEEDVKNLRREVFGLTNWSGEAMKDALRDFLNGNKVLWYVFLATLICQVVNTINWIAGFF